MDFESWIIGVLMHWNMISGTEQSIMAFTALRQKYSQDGVRESFDPHFDTPVSWVCVTIHESMPNDAEQAASRSRGIQTYKILNEISPYTLFFVDK